MNPTITITISDDGHVSMRGPDDSILTLGMLELAKAGFLAAMTKAGSENLVQPASAIVNISNGK